MTIFGSMVYRCKMCSDTHKLPSGGGADIANLMVCHFPHLLTM